MAFVLAFNDPDMSTSNAVITTSLFLLVTVLVAATVSVPVPPVESESALITSALLEAAASINDQ